MTAGGRFHQATGRPATKPWFSCVQRTFFHVDLLQSMLLSSDKKQQCEGGRVHLGLQYKKGTVNRGGEDMVLVWAVWVDDRSH